MGKFYAILLVLFLPLSAQAPSHAIQPHIIPPLTAPALDGHQVRLPRDLSTRATILILGFSRNSAETTTAWERPIRSGLAQQPAVGFYDMPMLAEVPGFVRPLVLRSIRKQVPDILKPNFVPLLNDEPSWKQAAGFSAAAPDAAYVLLVDRNGLIRWQTHEPFSLAAYNRLSAEAHKLTN